jgi:hypothetical protein
MDVRRILFVMWKEILELRQDPRIFGIIFVAPVVQLAVLGYAATTDVRNVPIVVVDMDRSSGSRELISQFTGSGIFEIVDVVSHAGDVDQYLEAGRAWMAVSIPARYGESVATGRPATLQVVADGSDASSTNIAMAIVREREIGTLEQLNVTPLGRLELIVGKLLPYGAIGLIDVIIVLMVIVFWFEVPMRGSFWLLVAMSAIYLLTTLGLGLFVSTISKTQQQAMMTSTFFFLIPMMYLSGFVFPIENMPDLIQPITYLIPLRYFVIILRGIFLKGVGLETLWPQALALFAWGVAILSLAVMRSSKRLA